METESQPLAFEPGLTPTVPGPRHTAASSTPSFLGHAGSIFSLGFAVQVSMTAQKDPDPKHKQNRQHNLVECLWLSCVAAPAPVTNV